MWYLGRIAFFLFLIGTIDSTVDIAKHPEITAVEDLMREHGLLNRALLIYDECIRRLKHDISFPIQLLDDTATIIQDFVEKALGIYAVSRVTPAPHAALL